MDRQARLQLLFQQDESLLQTDTHLTRMPPADVGMPDVTAAQSDGKKSSSQRNLDNHSLSDQPLIVEDVDGERDGHPRNGKKIDENADDSTQRGKLQAIETDQPVGGASQDTAADSFCPLLAVSRFPYKFIRGELRQQVARRFFDQGRFWNRGWDL